MSTGLCTVGIQESEALCSYLRAKDSLRPTATPDPESELDLQQIETWLLKVQSV